MSSTDPTQQQPGASQQPVPQYVPHQSQPHQSQPPQWPQQVPQYPAGGRINVLGIMALGLLTLLAILSLVTPLIYRQVAYFGSYSGVAIGLSLVQGLLVLVAIGLAIGGVLQRSATRMRWTAVGALVSGGLSLLSMAGAMIGGWIASALPYVY